jgi:S1-C subfamily serine protease
VAVVGPAQIYSSDHIGVVTVQGINETEVHGFFGTQTSVETVLGSGFVMEYENSSYIVTNYHVVDGIKNLTVTFSDGDAYAANVVGTDPYADLAVLTVTAPSSEFVPLQVVSSSGVTVGEQVYAIGNPYGLSGSMTVGIISQLGRTIQDPVAGNFLVAGVIQFSAAINPGNSGGPLLDASGQVIGITTATVSSSQGIGFAIPSSTIMREMPYLVATGGYSDYSYMGISTVDNSLPLAEASGTSVTYGVLVETVAAGSPAASAGLHAGTKTVTIEGSQYLIGGDIIVSVNGTKIIDGDALSTYLVQNTVPGQTIVLGVIRSGSLQNVTLVLGSRPPA